MRRNPTLPTIKQTSAFANSIKTKQTPQSYRKIEDKINSHDEQIVKNQKIISNLANEFRMLKEQLQFQQQYNQKYKSSMTKYEEQTSKHLKMIRDQKHSIVKLEQISKDKQKNLELMNKEKILLRQKNEELGAIIGDLNTESKKKQVTIKQLQTQLERAKKQIKQKQAQIKLKQAQIRDSFMNDRNIKQSKLKKLEKDLQLANIYCQNHKEVINGKDKQIQRLSTQIFHLEQKIKFLNNNQSKAKTMVQQIKLIQKQNDDLKNKLNEYEQQLKKQQTIIKNHESKNSLNSNQKSKQIHLEKKELNERVDKLLKESEQLKKKIQNQKKEKQKIEKREQQIKDRLLKLQSFYQKLNKSKGEVGQQLAKLKQNILCDYCNKPMKNPVTNIPCGHSYCQQCKNGYLKQCKKCTGLKREAVYRNELLDQIIVASNLIEKMIILIDK